MCSSRVEEETQTIQVLRSHDTVLMSHTTVLGKLVYAVNAWRGFTSVELWQTASESTHQAWHPCRTLCCRHTRPIRSGRIQWLQIFRRIFNSHHVIHGYLNPLNWAVMVKVWDCIEVALVATALTPTLHQSKNVYIGCIAGWVSSAPGSGLIGSYFLWVEWGWVRKIVYVSTSVTVYLSTRMKGVK